MKQYCPMKPTKHGYKVWALNDTHTGYMYNFAVYCVATPGVTEHGLDASVVRTMTEPVLADKEHLLNSTHGSKSMVNKSENKKTLKQHLKRGDHPSQVVSPGVQCFMWMDKEVVHSSIPYRLQSIQSNNIEAQEEGWLYKVTCPSNCPCSCTTCSWGEWTWQTS